MRAREIREFSDDELTNKYTEAKEELFNLRFQLVAGQLDNNQRIKAVKREIARILTIRRQRELDVEGKEA